LKPILARLWTGSRFCSGSAIVAAIQEMREEAGPSRRACNQAIAGREYGVLEFIGHRAEAHSRSFEPPSKTWEARGLRAEWWPVPILNVFAIGARAVATYPFGVTDE
jgi:hypothetical protein